MLEFYCSTNVLPVLKKNPLCNDWKNSCFENIRMKYRLLLASAFGWSVDICTCSLVCIWPDSRQF